MKNFKRILASLLVISLLVGMIPASAIVANAADESSTIIAMSDYQNSSLSSDEKKTVPQTIVNAMVKAGVTPELALIGGDYTDGSVGADGDDVSSANLKTELGNLTSILTSGWSNLPYYAIQGNHDSSEFLTDGTLNATGAYEKDDYIIYLINEDSFPWWQGNYGSGSTTSEDKATVTATAETLEKYLDSLQENGNTKPVIIMSHVPMHWTVRSTNTAWYYDNIYANILFDVVNDAAEEMDILFLFGHNHSSTASGGDYDNEIGGALAYVAKGESMKVPNGVDGTSNYTIEELNFTYMNAGYVGKYAGSTTNCSISAITIDSDSIDIDRYTYNGTVYEETIELKNVESTSKTLTDSATGITVKVPSDNTLTVKTVDKVDVFEDETKYSAYNAYDITLGTALEDGEEATVTIPASGYTSKAKVYYVNGDSLEDMHATISNGVAKFKTTHFSTYAIVEETAGDWIEIPSSLGGKFTLASSIEEGEIYLLVSNTSNQAIKDTGNNYTAEPDTWGSYTTSISAVEMTLSSDAFETTDENLMWKAVSGGIDGYYRLQNVATGKYLVAGSEGRYGREITTTSDTSTDYTNFKLGNYGIYAVKNSSSSNTYRYMRYSGSDTWFQSQATEQSSNAIRLWGADTTGTGTDTTYARLSSGLTQNYTTVDNVTEDTVLENVDIQVSADKETISETIDVTSDMVTWDTDFDGSTAGTYKGTVTYKGKELGTITVTITAKTVSSIALATSTGSVTKGARSTVETGGTITVTYSDNSTETINVTLGMLNNDGKTVGTYENLTVTYGGQTVSGFTLTVNAKEGNDFPEYPDPGSVELNKVIGDYSQFQDTGVAEVQLSTSGIPMNQGVDLVVIVDTSSSMDDEITYNGNTVPRYEVLNESLTDMLVAMKTPQEDGSIADIDVAIAEFNGYTVTHTKSSLEEGTHNWIETGGDGGIYGSTVTPDDGVMTGNGTISASGFTPLAQFNVDATENTIGTGSSTTNISDDIKTITSGTNYDRGLQEAYDLLDAKMNSWESGETRQQIVIFMTDGVPYQYNGVVSYYTATDWAKWLGADYESTDELPDTIANTNLYFNDGVEIGSGQPHFTAEAIKGTGNQSVVRVDSNGAAYLDPVEGLGATLYTIGFATDDNDNPAYLADPDNTPNILKKMASDEEMALVVNSDEADNLPAVFSQIAETMKMAATNAYFVDQMGDSFDLQTASSITKFKGTKDEETISLNPVPKITVSTYTIYSKNDIGQTIDGVTVTQDMVGQRYGNATVVETVTFNDAGTEAYSDGETTNIIQDGVIVAKNFFYNTTNVTKTITLKDGSTYDLPAETFYWNVGTISETEFVLSYYVYLEGSAEGTAEAGTYNTNNYATLYYTNWLDNDVNQSVQSPSLSWASASVYYGFYLVDDEGKPVVNQTTGETGSFADAVKLTNKIFYEEVLLNDISEVGTTIEIVSTKVPEEYEIYDDKASYTIKIDSNATISGWTIVNGKSPDTTYVTDYRGNEATNITDSTKLSSQTGVDYTSTTVWFAVKWSIQALPDTVVIDYGLPVDISVLTNDMFGENGKLAGVGAYSDSLNLDGYDSELASGFESSYTGTYGNATSTTATGKVRYTPSSMEMNGYDKFAYAVNYTGSENAGYYYDTVTVIPATTIYYEDDFLTYSASNTEWVDEGTEVEGATQDEDRPGQYSLTDANNIYGYDSVNKGMSTFSMGTAKKVHVDADSYATASFTFYGTGFDVIGMTSNTTGTIAVKVTDANGNKVKAEVVDTYYGYTSENHEILYTYTDGEWVAEDKGVATETTVTSDEPVNPAEGDTYTAIEQVWVATPDTANALYQVPVMQIEELPYGKYSVTITATYAAALDITTADGYDLYLDAIRIYDPTNDGLADGTTDTTIEDAYKADGEGWPSYIELRNKLISADTLGNSDTSTAITGLVFIDGDAEVGDAQIEDYTNYGPNNEVYIAPGQRVAFILNTPTNIANVHIGIKGADGNAGTYTITNIAQKADSENNISVGQYYNAKTYSIDTTTDMYYDITGWKNDIIVISNTGNLYNTTGVISITNIKSTYTSDPNAVATASEDVVDEETVAAAEGETTVYMTPAAATLTLRTLNASAEEETPDVDVPEVSEPEDDTTDEDTTVEPDTGDDTATEKPDKTETVKEAVKNFVNNIFNTVKNLFGKWFK